MEGPPTLAPQTAAPETLGELGAPDADLVTALVLGSLIQESDLETIVAAFEERGGGFVCDVILERGLTTETNLLRFFATHLRTRFVVAEKLAAASIDPVALEHLPVRLAEALGAIPLWWDPAREVLSCIVAVPIDGTRLARLREVVSGGQLHIFLATWSAVAAAQKQHYYRDANAFADFAPSGAGPAPERKPTEPSPETPSERTRVLFQSDHENLLVLRQENVRFRIAQEFHRRVQVLRGLAPQLEAIVELVFDLLTSDTVVIELSDGTRAFRSRAQTPDTKIPRSLIDEALRSPDGLLKNGIGLEGDAGSESVALKGIKSAMIVPLPSAEGSLGVVYIESLSAPAAFDENDLKMVCGVAAQAAAVIQNSRLLAQVEKEAEARTHLSRFLPPQLVDQAVAGGIDLQLDTRNAQATILYADIRGFTRATEQLGAEEIVRALAAFYEEMSEAVFDTQGMVDKFMGDCIMAVWGAPIAHAEHAQLALLAAKEMMRRAAAMKLGEAPLELGIGVSSGEVVVGAIGGSRRMDYTVIGPAVNVAARLCDLARGGQILASGDTLRASGEQHPGEELPPTALKGVAENVEIHRIHFEAPAQVERRPITNPTMRVAQSPEVDRATPASKATAIGMPAWVPPAAAPELSADLEIDIDLADEASPEEAAATDPGEETGALVADGSPLPPLPWIDPE